MSNTLRSDLSFVAYGKRWIDAWDRFWFTPRAPHTLGIIRIATGLMLLYSHVVVATELFSFVGDDAWVNNATIASIHNGDYTPPDAARSYLWNISNPLLLLMHHLLTLLVSACFAIGFLTRITAPLAWWLQLMLVHRMTGTLFGLDQVTTMLVMYLMLSPCGSVFSVDSMMRRKFTDSISRSKRLVWLFPDSRPSVGINIATRLIQLHLCIVYLFGGLWKARGTAWWDGTAIWFAVSNAQYQSIEITWIGHYPRLFSLLAHITVFWEVFYCGLVWPKLTRPLVLAIAFAVHGGIALFLGMVTFGTIMIVANLAFVPPDWLQRFGRGSSPELAHPPRVA
jgi:uncharacterized membrane protein YphA (DoxX/SURF4 family)